jgi:hypothetical protein
MTLIIGMIDAPLAENALRSEPLTREIAVALVRAIAQDPRAADLMIFLDDHQIGYLASEVSPDLIAAALDRLPEPTVGLARQAVARLLAFARADGWNLTIRTNDDQSWVPGITPEIRLPQERAATRSLAWSKGHLRAALTEIGLAFGSGENFEITASDLDRACQGQESEDAVCLAAIAADALARGGPAARIVAA